MKKNRRSKIIIAAGILAVILALGVALACSGSPSEGTVRKAGQDKTAQEVTAEAGTEAAARSGSTEKERCTSVPETTVHVETQRAGSTVIRVHEEHGETESTAVYDYTGHQETESSSESGTAGHQETQPRSEPETTDHVHSYVLESTRTVKHPDVTEQVWVEDSPAWDEVIRDGYHVCVVTCHECGAQFSDPVQANALEAWGGHIDEDSNNYSA